MEQEYINLIEDLDQTLSTLRLYWMDAKTPAEKATWRNKIDKALDERLRYMGRRDAAREFEKTAVAK